MRLGGPRRHVKDKDTAGRKQRREEVEFAGQVGQVLQDVEGKNGIEALLPRRGSQVIFVVKEIDGQLLPGGACPSKPHGYAVHVIVSSAMAAARKFKQDLAIARPVVKRGAAGEAQHL